MGELPRRQALTFFRDVTTLETLLAVLWGQTITMAPLLPAVVAELGPAELIEFGGHLTMLALYTAPGFGVYAIAVACLLALSLLGSCSPLTPVRRLCCSALPGMIVGNTNILAKSFSELLAQSSSW